MSTTVTYKGNTIATVNNNTKTLTTSGKYLEDNITLTDVSGGSGSATLTTKTITANGTYNAEDDDADGYSSVIVNVSGGSSNPDPDVYPNAEGSYIPLSPYNPYPSIEGSYIVLSTN